MLLSASILNVVIENLSEFGYINDIHHSCRRHEQVVCSPGRRNVPTARDVSAPRLIGSMIERLTCDACISLQSVDPSS
jgi:hypothetical protein